MGANLYSLMNHDMWHKTLGRASLVALDLRQKAVSQERS